MSDEKMLALIQEDRHDEFNRLVETNPSVDLSGAHLRAYDLRKFNLKSADLTNAYMRSTDLRSLDLRDAKLDGASMKDAKVSGVFFPHSLAPEEIALSLANGTRLRMQ